MNKVRTQQFQTYPPRTIARSTFRSLVENLDGFMLGLPVTARQIKARAISHARVTNLDGPDCWKVTDPHPLSELEHLQVELLLAANPNDSCELHIEFRQNHIFLSVSDMGTSWGKAVFEEARHLLEIAGVSGRGWRTSIARSYQLLEITQTLLMTASAAVFALWLKYDVHSYMYAALGLAVSGATPTLRRIFYFFYPPKKVPIIQESGLPSRKFPWVEASSILGFAGAVLSLVKELLTAIGTK